MTTYNLSTHASGTDCYSCHQSTLSGGVFTSSANWTGGNYSHSPKPATCLNCHTYPTATAPSLTGSGLSLQDHSGYGGQDCVGCHTSPPNYTSISGWGGANTTPSGLVNGTGSAWNFWTLSTTALSYTTGQNLSTATTATTAGVKLPQQMSHSSPVVTAGQLASCTTCHTTGQTSTSGTRYHTSIGTQPTNNCASCHSPGAVPTGIVGPITGSTDPANMNHGVNYTSGTSIVAAQDCSACHTSGTGTTWGGAYFHKNTGGNGVGACITCHISSMPKTTYASSTSFTPSGLAAIPQHFSHTAAGVTQDCNACHSQMGPPNTWVTTNKIHSIIPAGNLTSCNACHSADAPSATTNVAMPGTSDIFIHTAADMVTDCATCHAMTDQTTKWLITRSTATITAPSNTTGVTWAGGLYDHKNNGARVGTGSSCNACH